MQSAKDGVVAADIESSSAGGFKTLATSRLFPGKSSGLDAGSPGLFQGSTSDFSWLDHSFCDLERL